MVANITRVARSLWCFIGLKFIKDFGYQKKFHTSIMLLSMVPPKDLKFKNINKNVLLTTTHNNKSDGLQPLVVIFSWIMSQKKHVKKYSDFYTNRGFEVLTVKATPFQLLWPTKGSQVTVDNVLEYLTKQAQYRPILIHAFSVGAYMVGETMVKMETKEKYQAIASRIVGQIYDSAVDYQKVASGVANSINLPTFIQKLVEIYVRLHLRIFHNIATRHYIRSSEKFHDTTILAPSLFLFSKSDPLGAMAGILSVIRQWEAKGVKVYSRCWEKSPHCNHFTYHQEEYIEELDNFLKRLNLQALPIQETSNDSKLYLKSHL